MCTMYGQYWFSTANMITRVFSRACGRTSVMSKVIFNVRWSMPTLAGAAIYGTTRQLDPRTPAHGGVFFFFGFLFLGGGGFFFAYIFLSVFFPTHHGRSGSLSSP